MSASKPDSDLRATLPFTLCLIIIAAVYPTVFSGLSRWLWLESAPGHSTPWLAPAVHLLLLALLTVVPILLALPQPLHPAWLGFIAVDAAALYIIVLQFRPGKLFSLKLVLLWLTLFFIMSAIAKLTRMAMAAFHQRRWTSLSIYTLIYLLILIPLYRLTHGLLFFDSMPF